MGLHGEHGKCISDICMNAQLKNHLILFCSISTPSRTEVTKGETLKSLMDVLQDGNAKRVHAGHSSSMFRCDHALHATIDALWLKVYRKHDKKKKKNLENVTMTRKPPPSPPPSVLTLQPRYFCILCVYESTQLATAPKGLVLVFQTAAAKN